MATDLRMLLAHPGFQVAPGFHAAPDAKEENQEGHDFRGNEHAGEHTAQRKQNQQHTDDNVSLCGL